MKLRVLGCSGGIGRAGEHTTALLIDDDILIDAGTGVAALDLDQLRRIDHVFVTHSHLDHIAFLPLLLDAVGEQRTLPLTVHVTAATEAILRAHIFNWTIWPDFSVIPSPAQPCLRFSTVEVGRPVVLGVRTITALPVDHTVPAVGYLLDSGSASLAFSGDTGACDAWWAALNAVDNLRYLIIETAFANAQRALAVLSKHLCPALLHAGLGALRHRPALFITHLKPQHAQLIMAEIAAGDASWNARMLQTNQMFEL